MADYQYLLINSITGAVMEELPLSGVSYMYGLNGSGRTKASIQLTDPKCTSDNIQTLTREIAVLREDQPVAMGPITALNASLVSKTMEITCGSPWWWTMRMTTELDITGTDAGDVLWQALSVAQGKVPNGDKRITQASPFNPLGYSDNFSFPGAERRYVSDIADELVSRYPGFDFMINLSSPSGVPTDIIREFQVYYPTKGTTIDQALNAGNGMTNLTMGEDGTSTATRVHELGQVVSNTQRLVSMNAVNADDLPMTELVISRSNVDDLDQLALWATGDLFLRQWPLRLFGATFKPNPAIPYGAITPGDTVLIDATLGNFEFSTSQRVGDIEVTVSASGDEDVELSFNAPGATVSV